VPRKCAVCSHADKEIIDEALVWGLAFPALVAKYRVSKDSLSRHKANHLPATLAKAHEAGEVARGDDLLADVRDLHSRAYSILDKAEGAGDLRTALGAIREARGNLELLAKLLGELDERPVTNVLVSAEWVMVRTAMLEALGPHPQARIAVAERLSALEDH
jgi:hypothetical protein